jgi:hypothetical protein
MTTTSSPRHGMVRNHQLVTRTGEEVVYETPDGQQAYRGPAVAVTEPHSERYCEGCQQWKPLRGFLAQIGALLVGCPDCKRRW